MWPFKNKYRENSAQLERELEIAVQANKFLEKMSAPMEAPFQYGSDFKKNVGALLFSSEFETNSFKQLQSYISNATDYAAVYAIANTIASLPPKLFRKDAKGQLEPVDFHPDASPLLDRVNPFYTWYDYIEGLVTLTELAGFEVTEIVNPENPKELWLTRPDQVRVVTDRFGIAGYEVTVRGFKVRLSTEEAFQVKYFNPIDLMRGVSAFHAINKSLSADFFAQQFVNAYFRNGGHVGGMVESQSHIDFQSDEFQQLKNQFNEIYSGSSKAFKTLFLPNQMSYKNINVNPKDADVDPIRKLNRMEILSGRGVPPILIGHLDGASYANANVQLKTFFKNTVLPKKKKFEEALTSSVFSKWDLILKFDTSGVDVLKEGAKEKADTANVMSQAGVFTINEIRQETFGYNELKDGDVIPTKSPMIELGKSWQKKNGFKGDSSAYAIGRLLEGQD